MIRHSRPNIKRKDLLGVLDCLVSDNIADGSTVKEFERDFAALYQLRSSQAVAASSGLDALFLGLKGMGIGPGDEVIIPSYVCAAPYHAVVNAGATPVICDVGGDYCIDYQSFEKKISDKTKAVIVVHNFGMPADLQPFIDRGIPVIEDCAQSLGAQYKDQYAGSYGKFAFFSFYATKMITTGYGGMFLSRDTRLAAEVRDMRSYDKKDELKTSFNCNMSDIQAAMGINQLRRLDHFVELRRTIAEVYNRRFLASHQHVPPVYEDRKNVYFRYPLRVKRSLKEAMDFLHKNKIEAARPVYKPLHQYLGLPAEEFPETEKIYLKTLSIPIYPALLNKEVEYIARIASRIE